MRTTLVIYKIDLDYLEEGTTLAMERLELYNYYPTSFRKSQERGGVSYMSTGILYKDFNSIGIL